MSEWIPWIGGECPVHPKAVVAVRLEDGVEGISAAEDWHWGKCGNNSTIAAYRVFTAFQPEGVPGGQASDPKDDAGSIPAAPTPDSDKFLCTKQENAAAPMPSYTGLPDGSIRFNAAHQFKAGEGVTFTVLAPARDITAFLRRHSCALACILTGAGVYEQ